MGGCQNYGPFLGTLNIRCRIIIGAHKGTIILQPPIFLLGTAIKAALVWGNMDQALQALGPAKPSFVHDMHLPQRVHVPNN